MTHLGVITKTLLKVNFFSSFLFFFFFHFLVHGTTLLFLFFCISLDFFMGVFLCFVFAIQNLQKKKQIHYETCFSKLVEGPHMLVKKNKSNGRDKNLLRWDMHFYHYSYWYSLLFRVNRIFIYKCCGLYSFSVGLQSVWKCDTCLELCGCIYLPVQVYETLTVIVAMIIIFILLYCIMPL